MTEDNLQQEFLEWLDKEPVESTESFYKRIDSSLKEVDEQLAIAKQLEAEFEPFEPLPDCKEIDELFQKAINAAKAFADSGKLK